MHHETVPITQYAVSQTPVMHYNRGMPILSVEKKCYVCGITLDDYPYDPESLRYNESVICPACGIHYGFDEAGAGDVVPTALTNQDWKFGDATHKQILRFWRERWIAGGMQWWSPLPPPTQWNPTDLLKTIPADFQ